MIILGLTGSIGMGKTTTAAMFTDCGIPVFSADEAVHALYRGRAVPLINVEFPGTICNGSVDREKLTARILENPEALQKLEAIVHPLVHQEERAFVTFHRNAGEALVVLDIPLLFESASVNRVDRVLVVTAPADVQRERVMSRPGMTEEKFAAILGKQLPDSQKRDRADYIVDTSQGMKSTREAIRQLVDTLTQEHEPMDKGDISP